MHTDEHGWVKLPNSPLLSIILKTQLMNIWEQFMPNYKAPYSKRIFKFVWIGLILMLFLGASPGAFEKAYEVLLSNIEKQGAPVSITSCFIIDPDYNNEKLVYSMIFPWKDIKTFKVYEETMPGILIQKDKEGTVVNMAKLDFSTEEHSLIIAEANGGIWTYKKLGEIVNLMNKNNFSKVTSENIRKTLQKTSQTKVACK